MGMYQVTVTGTQDQQAVVVTNSFSKSGASNYTDALACVVAMANSWEQNIMPLCADDYICSGFSSISPDNPLINPTAQNTVPGGLTGAPLPMFVVARVKVLTGIRGRSYQGRWGYPGLTVADLDSANGNMMNAGSVASRQAAIDDHYADMLTAGFTPCVISLVTNGAPRAVPIATDAISVSVLANLGSRVSRKN